MEHIHRYTYLCMQYTHLCTNPCLLWKAVKISNQHTLVSHDAIVPLLTARRHQFPTDVLVLYLPQHGITLSGIHPVISASSKTLTFYNKDTRGEIQRASFNEEQVKRVFHGSFHKVDTTHWFSERGAPLRSGVISLLKVWPRQNRPFSLCRLWRPSF